MLAPPLTYLRFEPASKAPASLFDALQEQTLLPHTHDLAALAICFAMRREKCWGLQRRAIFPCG